MNILRDTLLDFVGSQTPDIYFKPCIIYPVFNDPLFHVKSDFYKTSIDINLSDSLVHLDNIATSLRPGDILISNDGLCFTSSGDWTVHNDLYVIPLRFIPGEFIDCLEGNGLDIKSYFE